MKTHTKPKLVLEDRTIELSISMLGFESIAKRWKDLESNGWQLFVVAQSRGYCCSRRKWITIPVWAIDKKSNSYWVYYVAHELAHSANALQRYGILPHGPEFMEEFKSICPVEYWHHELEYKDRNATSAGISMKHSDKAVDVKVINFIDLL